MRRIENEWRYFDEDLNIPYPWYTKGALQFLEMIPIRGKRIFEYGVGDSTEWYRRNGALCYGVDNNLEFAHSRNSYFEAFHDEYLACIENPGCEFDIVVIDGVWRDECTEYTLKHLKSGGYLIIDNYKQKSADLEHWPLTEKLIEGKEIMFFKEPDHQDWQTIIVVK
jgi:hypothetical protein